MAGAISVRCWSSRAHRYSANDILLRNLSKMQRDTVEHLRMAIPVGSARFPYMPP
jgi:hypothetical protein